MIKLSTVITYALDQVGYLEKKTNSQLDDKTANAGYNNFTKYQRDVDNAHLCDVTFQGQAWCAGFVMACFLNSYGKQDTQRLLCLPATACKAYNCEAFAKYFQTAGKWYTSNPQPGDVIFFQTFNSNGTIKYNYAHVGLVVNVENGKVITVEGNTSGGSTVIGNGGGVCKKSYTIGYKGIKGFGRPSYDIRDTVSTSTKNYLSVGDSGSAVREMQLLLNKAGYICDVDGEFGPKTEAQVKAFQNKHMGANEVDGCYGPRTKTALEVYVKSTYKPFGVDVSVYQGDFNFTKAVNEGVTFAVIKAGGADSGYYIDKKFERNYTSAKNCKLPIGCYWFSKALTIEDAKKEAKYFYDNCLKGKQYELPVYIDIENKQQLSVGKKLLTDIAITWMNTIREYGYLSGVYTSKNTFLQYFEEDRLQYYPHWVASWAKTCNYTPQESFTMWQFGGETNTIRSNTVAGVVCDQNYMLIDYTSEIKTKGFNGYGSSKPECPVTVENLKPVVELGIPELRYGDNSVYVSMLQGALNYKKYDCGATDGAFGNKTKTAIANFQKGNNLPVTYAADKDTLELLMK